MQKVLLVFSTLRSQHEVVNALPQEILNSQLSTLFIRHPNPLIVFDAIDAEMREKECNTCLIINRHMQPEDVPENRLLPNYYIINFVEQLEEALNVQIEDRSRRTLTNTVLPSMVQVRAADRILFGTGQPLIMTNNGPFILEFDFAPLLQQQQQQQPVVREPINEVWENRLASKRRKVDVEEDIEGESTCIICLDDPPSIMLAPCQHQCLCEVCAREVLERSDQKKQCPICRAEIQEIYKPIL